MILLQENYPITNTLFKNNKKSFVFNSIIEGFTPGRIYLDNVETPNYYVVFDGGNFVLYVGGNITSEDTYKECANFINKSILTDELKTAYDSWILIACDNDDWQSGMDKHLDYKTLHKGSRTLYHHVQKTPLKIELDQTTEIKSIDIDVLNSSLQHVEDLKEEVSSMWGDQESFVKNGFGTCAVTEDNLLSWCTAEFLSQGACGIGIETVEDAQKKGIATAVASAFVNLCYKRNITPYWDSWTKNLASIRVAEKTGFEKLQTYDVMIVEF